MMAETRMLRCDAARLAPLITGALVSSCQVIRFATARPKFHDAKGEQATYEVLIRKPVRCFLVGRRFVGVAALELVAGVTSPRIDGAVGELVLSISSCVLFADLVVLVLRVRFAGRFELGAGVLADLRKFTAGEDAAIDPALLLMSEPRIWLSGWGVWLTVLSRASLLRRVVASSLGSTRGVLSLLAFFLPFAFEGAAVVERLGKMGEESRPGILLAPAA